MGRVVNADANQSTLALVNKTMLLEQELAMLEARRTNEMAQGGCDKCATCPASAAAADKSKPPGTSTAQTGVANQHSEMEAKAAREIMGS